MIGTSVMEELTRLLIYRKIPNRREYTEGESNLGCLRHTRSKLKASLIYSLYNVLLSKHDLKILLMTAIFKFFVHTLEFRINGSERLFIFEKIFTWDVVNTVTRFINF